MVALVSDRYTSMLRVLLCLAALLCLSQAELAQVRIVQPTNLEPTSRIIGGTAAPIERYPYTIQLFRWSSFICGGSLLTRRHVLSAAHCFFFFGELLEPGFFFIRAGSAFIALDSDGQTSDITRIVIHESYNPVNLDCDLALLQLEAPMSLNIRVQTAPIPVQEYSLPYESTLVAVGWGQTEHTPVSEVLKDVWLQKVNWAECAEAYERRANYSGTPYEVTANMFCSGWHGSGGLDACFGDSGGPVVAFDDGGHVVVGVTSWGPSFECAHPEYVGVNVRLSKFTDWINSTVTGELAVEEGSGDEGSGDEGSGDDGSGDEGNGDEGSGDEGSGDDGSGDEGSGDEGSGDEGSGEDGSGDEDNGAPTHLTNSVVLVVSFLVSLLNLKYL